MVRSRRAVWVLGLLFIVGASSALFSAQQGLDAGLIAYWPLNEGAGETARDVSGRGHDGSLQNGPAWTQGRIGGGLRFDGTDDFVLVPYHQDFDLSNAVTIVLWAYIEAEPNAGPGNDWRLLLGDARSGSRPYGLILEQDRRLAGSVYINDERQVVRSAQQLALNEWAHVAFTYDGATGLARLYLNGTLLREETRATGNFELKEERSVSISMRRPSSSEELHSWPGRLDEVRIYSRALTAEEIRTLFFRTS